MYLPLYVDFGYKPYVISTIVDRTSLNISNLGYKPYVISTIVDLEMCLPTLLGYKPYVISTIVDSNALLMIRLLAISLM